MYRDGCNQQLESSQLLPRRTGQSLSRSRTGKGQEKNHAGNEKANHHLMA
jgi:hypothetical protein